MLAKTNVASIKFICIKYATRLHSFTKSLSNMHVLINYCYLKLFHLLRGIHCHITTTDKCSIKFCINKSCVKIM